jgi:hypothetical protein
MGLGLEIISNGTFDSDLTDWTHDGYTTWNAGAASIQNYNSYLYQEFDALGYSDSYQLSIEITEDIAGTSSLEIWLSTGGSPNVYGPITGVGVHLVSIPSGLLNTRLTLTSRSNNPFKIDNVSLREVLSGGMAIDMITQLYDE